MKKLLTILAIFFNSSLYAQDFTPVDRTQVEKVVTDPNSENYYPKLLKRYQEFDSTLTLEHYRLLYYGFVFQEKYSGYNDHKKKEIRDLFQKEDYKKAIKV